MMKATSIWPMITLFATISIFTFNFTVLISSAVDIKGTQAADTMQGTTTDDDIRGYNGDDIINGLQGNDKIE